MTKHTMVKILVFGHLLVLPLLSGFIWTGGITPLLT